MVMSAALTKKALKSASSASDPLIEVAKKIADTMRPEAWLIDFLVVASNSIDPRYRVGHAEIATEDLKNAVLKVANSADEIIQSLSSPPVRDVILLNSESLSVELVSLLQTLLSLRDVANQAHPQVGLGSGSGLAYDWPNYIKPKIICALIIREAWRRYGNRSSPGVGNPDASEAAELLWTAKGNRARAGAGKIADWKREFKEAVAVEAASTPSPMYPWIQRWANMAQAGKLSGTK